MTVRPAAIEDAPQIARVHVDSWRSTYSEVVPEDFLATLSHEDFEARWRSWLGDQRGLHKVFYMVELPAGSIAGFAAGGPRQEESNDPEHEGELYAAYRLQQHQRRGLDRRLLGAVARECWPIASTPCSRGSWPTIPHGRSTKL
jgi:ribosomal protein S18 acetylase RimI-like enzyme